MSSGLETVFLFYVRRSRSSFYGQTTGPQIKKDPRNISDKGTTHAYITLHSKKLYKNFEIAFGTYLNNIT